MQNPYFELLKELTALCEKNSIDYCLAGKILYFISHPEEEMSDRFSEMEIIMDGANAKKLIKACRSLPEDRVLETPLRNCKFRNLDMFYINAKTTGVDFSLLDRREFLGIHIPIRIIRPDFSKTRHKLFKKMDIIWRMHYGYHYANVMISEKEEKLYKMFDGIRGNGDKITPFLFRLYLNTSIKDVQKKAFIYGKRSIKAVPVSLLHTKIEAEIKGNTFPVMERYDKYASIFFGKTWKKRSLETPRTIVDAQYADREFERALFQNDDFWNRKNRCKKMLLNYKLSGREYESSWEMAGCVYRGVTIEKRLAQQKDLLAHMLRLQNYTGILSKMKQYKEVLQMQKKYDVELDQELNEIYLKAEAEASKT